MKPLFGTEVRWWCPGCREWSRSPSEEHDGHTCEQCSFVYEVSTPGVVCLDCGAWWPPAPFATPEGRHETYEHLRDHFCGPPRLHPESGSPIE